MTRGNSPFFFRVNPKRKKGVFTLLYKLVMTQLCINPFGAQNGEVESEKPS